MKIAVWHNLPSGGGKRALWQHVAGLVSRGHHVESWCPSTADQTFLPLSKLCTEHVVPFSQGGKRNANLGRWRLLKEMDANCRESARQMEGKGFDVLFANSCGFFATTPIARHVHLPSVLYLGEPRREFYEALPKLLWLTMTEEGKGLRQFRTARFLANWLRLHAMRTQAHAEISNAEAFDQILVNSLFSRESVMRAYGLDSRVCYLGVDTERFRPSCEPTEDYVMGLGAIGYNKGLDRAVKAVGAVPESLRPKLLWVGNRCYDDHYRNEVTELAKSLNVQFDIREMVADKELVSLLNRSVALLYTSRLEPFGLAPLEANACGVPVIAVAEGGVRETIEHGRNGLMVSTAEPKDLASAIVTILSNPTLAKEMRSHARDTVVPRWTLEAAISNLEVALLQRVNHGRSVNGNKANHAERQKALSSAATIAKSA
jgi:glycosyltransferase involved in cell wall biosynthesis